MAAIFYQSDKRWSHITLGHGPSTIGRAGCVLTSLAMAADMLGGAAGCDPIEANRRCMRADAYQHWTGGQVRRADLLSVARGAIALGFLSPEHEHVEAVPGHASLSSALGKALTDGCALIRVDHTGDARGDHTILALRIDTVEGRVHCLDPAVGPITLRWPELTAEVQWRSKTKTYRVTKVQPCRRLAH